MILSVSRRTDIPAFYSEWFFNRLQEGYVLVRNPMNYHQVSRVELRPDTIDGIVFWTKDPRNMLNKLEKLENYPYYFLITLTPYDKKIEKGVPSKEELVTSFRKLSDKIGKKRTLWRYDPIILTEEMDVEYHVEQFELFASKLSGYTEKCLISFVAMYKKTARNMSHLKTISLMEEKKWKIASELSRVALKHQIKLETCSEEMDFSLLGIEKAKCIDDKLISEIVGEKITIPKDPNQRESCGCVASIDVGTYNTCQHGCVYCYANHSEVAVMNKIKHHDPISPMLVGWIEKEDKISNRKVESYRKKQLKLF